MKGYELTDAQRETVADVAMRVVNSGDRLFSRRMGSGDLILVLTALELAVSDLRSLVREMHAAQSKVGQ